MAYLGSDADNVRRAIGRKQMDRLQSALPQILEGYCNKSDKPREVAEEEAKTFKSSKIVATICLGIIIQQAIL